MPAVERVLDTTVANAAPNAYAGSYGDAESGGVVVLAVEGREAELVGELDREGLTGRGVPLTVVKAKHSLAFLQSEIARLQAAVPHFTSVGISFSMFGIDVRNNRIEVGVPKSDADIRKLVSDYFGDTSFVLTDVTAPRPATRTADSSPWTGGDWITATSGGYTFGCTSGFSMIDGNGATYNSAAGHCGSLTWRQNGAGYGVTLAALYCNYCIGDIQSISSFPGSASGAIWTSCQTCTNTNLVHTWANPAANDVVVFNGYVSGPRFGSVDLINTCVQYIASVLFPTTYVCGLDRAKSSAYIVQHGDSGGPIVTANLDGSLNASGWISGLATGSGNYYAFFTPPGIGIWDLGLYIRYG